MTVMAEAFAKAGFKPVPEKLRDMMATAIAAGKGKADASSDYFIAALAKARDPDLLWELFAPVRQQTIADLFSEVMRSRDADVGHNPVFSQEAKEQLPASAAKSGVGPYAASLRGVPTPDTHSDLGQKASSSQEVINRFPGSEPNAGAGHQAGSLQKVGPGLPAPARSKVRYAEVAAGAARTLRNFTLIDLHDHGDEVRLASLRVSALPRRLRALAKRTWVAGTEYNLLLQVREWIAHQAYVAPNATVSDILDEKRFQQFLGKAVSVTEAPMFMLPQDLEKTNAA